MSPAALHRPGLRIARALVLITLAAGCAPAIRSGETDGYEYLVIENRSPDVIRVWFNGGFGETVIGDVRPLGRARLRVWRRDVAHDLRNVYFRVAPLTAPVHGEAPSRIAAASSKLFRAVELPDLVWTYTGQQLIADRR